MKDIAVMGGAAGFLAGTQLRRRRWAVVAVAALVGLVGGLAMALIAGSRLSASVVDRFFATGIPYDLQVGGEMSMTRDDLLALPDVVRADPTAYVAMLRVGPETAGGVPINGLAADWESVDPMIRVLDGDVPDGADVSEVMVNEGFVDLHHLGVGDVVDVQMFGTDQFEEVSAGNYDPTGPRFTFRISGLIRLPVDIAVDEIHAAGQSALVSSNTMIVSYEFYERHADEFLTFGVGYDVQLAEASGARDRLVDTIETQAAVAGETPILGPPRFQDRRGSLESPVELETSALLLLGVGIGVTGTVMIGLLLRAERRVHEVDEPTLRALGASSRQLGATAVTRTAPVAIGGGILGVILAVALSSRFPVGIGRQLEPDPGVEIDLAVLGLGGALAVLVVIGLSYLVGRTSPKRGRMPPARLGVAGRLAAVGSPTEMVIGTQLAFRSGDSSQGSPRTAGIAGAAVAVAIVVAVAQYVAGVQHVYSVPIARGWPWDAVIGNTNFSLADTTIGRLDHDRRVSEMTAGRVCDATVGGETTEVLAIRPGGTAPPVVGSGRLPASPSEIALGARLGRTLDAQLGDLVRFSVADGDCGTDELTTEVDLTVVGVAVPPVIGEADIGKGAVVTLDAVAAAGGDDEPQLVMMNFDGDDPIAVGTSLERDFSEEIMFDSIPAEVVNLQRVRELPLIGLALAGILGTIVLAYTLALGQHRQLRDLAVMRALGLAPPQLKRAMLWQGVALAAAILLVGLPTGVVVGRAAWTRFAEGLGVQPGPITPWLVLLVPLCLVVAIAATLYPAQRARHASVARLLRAE